MLHNPNTMRVAGVREARLNLSELLTEVRKGREVVITDRGRPVARLVPPERTQGKPFTSRRRFRASVHLKGAPLSLTVAAGRADRL